ncbi:oligosaccharyltransferase subunit Stt3 [Schizosaccharomyces cryophilus OY26]|uniref:Dolichyl-diphosphooligosaccharide--protein glycosyltransferase subunit STT3 n=1 Tax=Schizosaccharomyces cryophilus (strain OY26 / ATCC MYA-4695 / CBS 11777 / NBRC 106824 / NRRL Y48691) TaxID=653667 RepID=S9XHI6_SCHCR|nr:oligosaccharyltransferase subunit Stt3 [Schizosaccharomyces cryophilus OY26]EPY53141.1 oligosaccharyltransferase subunit Stt3 [Schizosaccharomyces cryophilus OY26]
MGESAKTSTKKVVNSHEKDWKIPLKILILFCIVVTSVCSRLFSVIRYESIIHEFDPWFNFRATKVLVEQGFYNFLNWFDERSWYPLGRVAGGTLYPGLMVTSGIIYKVMHFLKINVDIRDICVLLAPAFSGLTAIATYYLARELKNDACGLLAAAFMGIAPGYTSRSVAGSYDNEAIAITLLMSTFALWIKAVKTGASFWGACTGLLYFYMVTAWGGYVFITNMIPLHVFVLLLMGRYTSKLYIAYTSYYVIGLLSSMQVPFVGFQPVSTSEHMSAMGVFGLVQLFAFYHYVKGLVSSQQFRVLLRLALGALVAGAFAGLFVLSSSGVIAPWTGRFYSLWDTNYAKIHIPIIASVSEHQPPTWSSLFFDLQLLIWLLPVGVYLCFKELRNEHVFIIIYAVMGTYFCGVMVRLILTLTPCVCIAAAVAISTLIDTYVGPDAEDTEESVPSGKATKTRRGVFQYFVSGTSDIGIYNMLPRIMVLGSVAYFLILFVYHSSWVTSNAYSSPTVVLSTVLNDGSLMYIDDFREVYDWLRRNTPNDAKVMSWWDYGYQIAGMADRVTLVDNNTWNNTHIATVGKAMSSNEEAAYPLLRKHDVDYILIIYGGTLGFSSDDMNKFLWMIRISQGIWPDEIIERNFFTPNGEYRTDDAATPTMRESLMYKMSYHGAWKLFPPGQGFDRSRNQRLPSKDPQLYTIEEAFTSMHHLVRLYKVKKPDTFGRDLKQVALFEEGKRKKIRRPTKMNERPIRA